MPICRILCTVKRPLPKSALLLPEVPIYRYRSLLHRVLNIELQTGHTMALGLPQKDFPFMTTYYRAPIGQLKQEPSSADSTVILETTMPDPRKKSVVRLFALVLACPKSLKLILYP